MVNKKQVTNGRQLTNIYKYFNTQSGIKIPIKQFKYGRLKYIKENLDSEFPPKPLPTYTVPVFPDDELSVEHDDDSIQDESPEIKRAYKAIKAYNDKQAQEVYVRLIISSLSLAIDLPKDEIWEERFELETGIKVSEIPEEKLQQWLEFEVLSTPGETQELYTAIMAQFTDLEREVEKEVNMFPDRVQTK